MSDNNDSHRKGPGVGTFMFMPQIGLSLNGFSHIYPVIVRCLAMIFVQAKLIPANHPALYYGAEGVPDSRISDLFGEAWFTLRTTNANAQQWGLFAAIILMITTLGAAIATAITRVAFGLGEVAQAQIFAHPCDPYTAGGCDTGSSSGDTSMAAVAKIVAPGQLFDNRVEGAGISTDYALMVLDKILRQAATGKPGNGGALQNALADLMGVYNSGVLLIAGAIIFWMIMSIIVDTAKTGVFGGGRHNMVWTPIRIVFALGIMVPLGSQGFSSGQYMVMKLAEWGSNFGTQGWVTYVNGVLTDKTLLAPFSAENATSLVSGVSKVMVCQVAYNTFLKQSTDTLDPKQVISVVKDNNARVAWVTNRYTNATASNVCGTIQYATDDNASSEDQSAAIQQSSVVTAMDSTSAGAAADPGNRSTLAYTNTGLRDAMQGFRQAMLGALKNSLKDDGGGAPGSGGTAINKARDFACKFVARRFGNTGTSPVNDSGNCSGVSAAATDPDSQAQQDMLADIMNAIETQYETKAKPTMQTYIDNTMLKEMKKRGWAGMGMWYQDIASMNGVIQSSGDPQATVTPGTIWSGNSGGNFWRCLGSRIVGRSCKQSDLDAKVVSILADYDRWWGENSRPSSSNTPKPTAQSNQDLKANGGDDVKDYVKGMKNESPGDDHTASWIAKQIIGRYVFPILTVDVAATGTYPLAQLSYAGHKLIWEATGIWVIITAIQTLSSIEVLDFSAGAGFAVSALMNAFATIGTSLMIGGIMLAFYLPILPFIRVAFAVLTWATSVFVAVVMVPIAGLAHLSSEGEGLAGSARTAWILWLNVLMRPILVVFGFVGGMLIFNAFAVYFQTTFVQGATSVMMSTDPFTAIIALVAYSIIFLGSLYTAANTSFKLMEVFPNALVRWMGGSPDHSMDEHNDGMLLAGTQLLGSMKPTFSVGPNGKGGKNTGGGASKAA